MAEDLEDYKADEIPVFDLQSSKVSLFPYYMVGIISTTIGIVVVAVLNLSTPLEFIQKRILGDNMTMNRQIFISFFLPRFIGILSISYVCLVIGIRRLLRPISVCLKQIKTDKTVSPEMIQEARQRILNLAQLFFPVNILIWIIVPVAIGMGSVITGMADHHTAFILAARASMVGLIASAIASQRIEAISRKGLIPFFFPNGHLTQYDNVPKISLSKRITFINRLGAVIPLLILLVTLLTLQWQLMIEPVSAIAYGRGIIIFTLILFIWTLFFSKQLNYLLSQNIVVPINKMAEVLRGVRKGEYDHKLQVVSNDEIGYAGDVVNEMTQGLKEREAMQKSLNLARQIQQSLLPKKDPEISGLDIAGNSVYCDETGGDYYDYLLPEDANHSVVRIVLGDVSGHGISSALLMTTSRAFFKQRSAMPGSLSEVVSQVNRLLCKDVEDSGNFMTLFSIEIDPIENRINWVRAGHDPAMLYDPEQNRFTELKGAGVALGVDEQMEYEGNQLSGVSRGHIIAMFTDGIWEAQDEQGVQFGKEKLKQLIAKYHDLSAKDILNKVMDASVSFQKDEKRQDDATLIIVKFLK